MKRRPSSLNELTSIISNIELTHLGSKTFSYSSVPIMSVCFADNPKFWLFIQLTIILNKFNLFWIGIFVQQCESKLNNLYEGF